MKNNIREILDETNINIVDELNILEYIDELEKVKEDYIKSLDKLDVLDNRLDKVTEYNQKIYDTSTENERLMAKINLDIIRGKDENNSI